MWSRYVGRMEGGGGSMTVDIPANLRGIRYVGIGPLHTAGVGFVQRADSALQVPVAPSALYDQPLMLTPEAPFILDSKGFDGPCSITFTNGFPSESATLLLCHPIIDVIWSDSPLPVWKRGMFYFTNTAPLTNGLALWVPTFGRRIVKLSLLNGGAGNSTTRVDQGIPDVSSAWRNGGAPDTAANRRLFKTFTVPLGGGNTIVQWGGSYAPAPDTPLAGENGQVPPFLKISETGASASTRVIVEAYD